MENIELYMIVLLIIIIIWFVNNTVKFYTGQKRKIKNLHRFAREGETDAQHDLARHYHKGEVVKRDYQKAAFWYQKAAFKGDEKSKQYLDMFLHNRIIKKKKC